MGKKRITRSAYSFGLMFPKILNLSNLNVDVLFIPPSQKGGGRFDLSLTTLCIVLAFSSTNFTYCGMFSKVFKTGRGSQLHREKQCL